MTIAEPGFLNLPEGGGRAEERAGRANGAVRWGGGGVEWDVVRGVQGGLFGRVCWPIH